MQKKTNWFLAIILLSALILRLSLVFVACHGDLNNNISWGTLAIERKLDGFYEGSNWPYSNPNQPPLTILTFYSARLVWQAIENISWYLNNNVGFFPSGFIWFWEGKGMTLLVKSPSIIADLIIGLLIYKYFIKTNKKKALIFSALWLFNPITWYNSSLWGQTDSVVNLLMLAGVLLLLKKDLIKSMILFTLCLLFKGSLSFFIPILFIYALTQRYPFKKWLLSLVVIIATSFVVSVWFHPSFDWLLWIINLYKQRIFPGEIGFLTANAFNFWWLVDSGKTLDSTVFFGLSARLWGLIITFGSLVGLMCWLKKKPDEKRLFTTLTLIALVSFLFMTRMHERYLYPFFLPATLLLGSVFWLVIPYIVLSLTHLLNLYHLFFAPSIPFLQTIYKNLSLMVCLSVLNLLTLGFILYQLFLKKPLRKVL